MPGARRFRSDLDREALARPDRVGRFELERHPRPSVLDIERLHPVETHRDVVRVLVVRLDEAHRRVAVGDHFLGDGERDRRLLRLHRFPLAVENTRSLLERKDKHPLAGRVERESRLVSGAVHVLVGRDLEVVPLFLGRLHTRRPIGGVEEEPGLMAGSGVDDFDEMRAVVLDRDLVRHRRRGRHIRVLADEVRLRHLPEIALVALVVVPPPVLPVDVHGYFERVARHRFSLGVERDDRDRVALAGFRAAFAEDVFYADERAVRIDRRRGALADKAPARLVYGRAKNSSDDPGSVREIGEAGFERALARRVELPLEYHHILLNEPARGRREHVVLVSPWRKIVAGELHHEVGAEVRARRAEEILAGHGPFHLFRGRLDLVGDRHRYFETVRLHRFDLERVEEKLVADLELGHPVARRVGGRGGDREVDMSVRSTRCLRLVNRLPLRILHLQDNGLLFGRRGAVDPHDRREMNCIPRPMNPAVRIREKVDSFSRGDRPANIEVIEEPPRVVLTDDGEPHRAAPEDVRAGL